MKTIKKLIFAIFVISLVYSCQKEMIDFQGDNGVYFDMRKKTPTGLGVGQCTDTTDVTFAETRADDSTVNVKLMLFGRVENYNRTVNIKIIDTLTTVEVGVDFEAFPTQIVFPAGKEFVIFPIKFIRSEGILNNNKFLGIEIDKSPDFPFQLETYKSTNTANRLEVFDNVTKHVFNVSDALFQPTVWNDRWFGNYSDCKFQYINVLFNLTQDDWRSFEIMPAIRMQYIGKNMKRHMQEQENAGTPVYERDRKGEIIYQKNSKGEYVLDKDGNKIPVKMTMGIGV